MYKEKYYIVSEEMRKAKERKQNFAINENLQELAEDISKLKEKYKENQFAMGALKEFVKILENADTKEKGNRILGYFKSIARKLGTDAASSDRSPNAVAGTRG